MADGSKGVLLRVVAGEVALHAGRVGVGGAGGGCGDGRVRVDGAAGERGLQQQGAPLT